MVAPSRQRGTTLVELAVSVVILALIAGSIAIVTKQTSSAYNTVSSTIHQDVKARRSMRKIRSILSGTGVNEIVPPLAAGTWTDRVSFQPVIGYDVGGAIRGPLQELRPQSPANDPVDGIDNDGDGLVDERHLVWIRDLAAPAIRPMVVCRNVAVNLRGELNNAADDNGNGLIDEPGACFTIQDGIVRFFLTTESSDIGMTTQSSYETQIYLLNLAP